MNDAFTRDERFAGADDGCGDREPLDHLIGIGAQERPVLEGAGLAFGAVGDGVAVAECRSAREHRSPLGRGRKAGAAAAAQPGPLELVEHPGRPAGSRRGERGPAAAIDVLLDRFERSGREQQVRIRTAVLHPRAHGGGIAPLARQLPMPSSVLPDLDAPHDLAPGSAAAFARDGHALVRGLATADEVAAYRPFIEGAAARASFERRPIGERDTYGAAFLQCVNLWRTDDAVRRFVFAPRFARAAADLLGVGGVRLYHDQALLKEPGGGHTPWHQDQFYWPFDTEQTVTMWMPLADLDPSVGSMTFATGSHRAGNLRGHAISDESEAEFARLVRDDVLRRAHVRRDPRG